MTFANPTAFILLILIVPLVLLYLFKEETRTIRVPSLLFWRHLEAHPRPSKTARMRRFLSSPLFWIQLLLLLLLIGALARPVLQQSARKVVLVMDVSASMQTREEGGTRMDRAKAVALETVDALEGADQAAVVTMGAQPELVLAFTDDRQRVRDRIKALQATDTATNVQAALALIPSLQDSTGGLDVVVISDRPAPQYAAANDSTAVRYRFRPVGTSRVNAGFVAMNRQSAWPDATGGDLLLRNYDTEERAGSVRIIQRGEVIGEQPVRVPPGGSVAVSIASLPASDPVEVVFDDRDSLTVDNRAFLIPSSARRPSLLAVTNDLDVARTFRQIDDFQVTVRSSRDGVFTGPGFDVYVYDRLVPSAFPPGGTVLINPPTSVSLIQEREIYDWDTDHPVLLDIVTERLPLTGARVLASVPPWAVALARTRTHPVLLSGDHEGYRRVITALDLSRHLENPTALLLLLKTVAWVNPLAAPQATHVRTGEPFVWQAAADTGLAAIITPSGETHRLRLQNGRLSFPRTGQAGVYTFAVHGETRYFAANLLDAAESDIRPYAQDQDAAPQLAAQAYVAAEYWRWGLWAFMGVLMLEWGYFFLRRKG